MSDQPQPINKAKLQELLEEAAQITNPGEYGLGSEPKSIPDDDKRAWERMGLIIEQLQETLNTGSNEAFESPNYREAYALVIDAHNKTRIEHDSLQGFISGLINLINGYTPYDAYFDYDYSDPITPPEE